MANKWVDNTNYFGPDRRKRGASKLWGERRRDNIAGQPPSLGIMLRRLRVLMLGLATPDDQRRALQMLQSAMGEADKLGYRDCAGALQAAKRALQAPGPTDMTTAAARVAEAINCLAENR
jgi:hypothetical protein